ncbi:glycosyltransferase [Sporomusa aerivorans]|uniref:glycosyltransferase n=1 Tax=Sporomusa aerivorans TaxID=204936 RepID=UPI00352B8A7B
MKISLCMIVKDEEYLLAKCLKAIRAHVDEIILVDTGSTDKTKVIARQFTDKIYDFPWCNDFARARNFSLLHANNDWILVLDADEIVTKFDRNSLAPLTQSTEMAVGRIKRINYIENKWGPARHTERISRVFNRQLLHYEGIIHEQIATKNKGSLYKTIPLDITVDHVGYAKEVINKTAKLERNITLLTQAIAACPDDPYLHYQLGKSYYLAKDFRLAYTSFSSALSLPLDHAYEYVQDLVESFGYTLINSEKYSEALEIEKFTVYYQHSPDFNFLMGLIFMNNALFSQAVESFLKCIGSGEGKIRGVNSYLANYNIAVIYELLGYHKEARTYYKHCGNYAPAKKRLAAIK